MFLPNCHKENLNTTDWIERAEKPRRNNHTAVGLICSGHFVCVLPAVVTKSFTLKYDRGTVKNHYVWVQIFSHIY